MSKSELEEVLKAMQMLHERLLRVETWMLNQEGKQNERQDEKSI
jgi:hypothetical protein